MKTNVKIIALCSLIGLLFVSCAGKSAIHNAEKEAKLNNWDAAVMHYARAVANNPNKIEYQMKLMRARINAAQVHIERGRKYQEAGLYPIAAEEYEQAMALDPTNQFAIDEFAKVLKLMREEEEAKSAGMSLETMKEAAAKITPTPKLNPQSDIPIKLRFSDQEMKEVFDAICRAAGINLLFDSTLPEKKITVDLQDVTFLQALDILGIQTGTFYKIIDSYTIIIAPDNRQKRQEYEDQVIKTFYLSNATVKDVFALIRGLIETRNIAQNDQLNAITIKDTPEKIAVAERIIRANDKAKGEVVVNVELLEVNKSRLRQIGPELSSYSFQQQFDIVDDNVLSKDNAIRLNELNLLKKEYNWLVGVPSVTYHLMKTTTNARVIARPQLRVTEGEKAQVHIGDQVPIATTTFSQYSTGVGGSITPITNYTYQNVGIQINLQPRVHHNQEVTLTLDVEVSSITGYNPAGQPTIGTRKIHTVIRLKNGQSNFLAGLIRDEERDSLSTVPGIGNIPILKRLFGSTRKQKIETDIVLSLTPHIIRMPNIMPEDLQPLWVGYGDKLRLLETPPPSVIIGKGEIQPDVSAKPAEPQKPTREPDTTTPQESDAPLTTEPDAFSEPLSEVKERPAPAPIPSIEELKSPPQQPPTIRVVPASMAIEIGEEEILEIQITKAINLAHTPLNMTFDPKIIQILDITEGGFLRQEGAPVTFVRDIDNEKGSAVVGYSRLEGGTSGDGVLVRVKIKGAGIGASRLLLSKSELKDADNQPIPCGMLHGSINVEEE